MAQPHSPTVRGRRLGRELRDLRTRADLTYEDVARQLGWHHTKVRRIEAAKTKPGAHDLDELFDLYGAGTTERAVLLDLAANAWRRGWWLDYQDVFKSALVPFESEATIIRQWEPQLVPGLMQTADYARVVIAAGRVVDDEVGRRVAARLARQELLSRPDAPRLDVVIDEAVLRRPIGGPAVMRAQLRMLVEYADRPNVDLRVVPEAAGEHPGLEGAFTVLSFEPPDPDVAFADGIYGNVFLESDPQVTRFRVTHADISEVALPPELSQAMIGQAAEHMAALAKE